LLHCERADIRDALHAELKALRKTVKLRQRKKNHGVRRCWTAIILYLAVAFYLLPTLITEIRSAEHATAIFLVNLLLDWTVLGWLAVLIWAATEKTAQIRQAGSP
jgi:hypothetical protein